MVNSGMVPAVYGGAGQLPLPGANTTAAPMMPLMLPPLIPTSYPSSPYLNPTPFPTGTTDPYNHPMFAPNYIPPVDPSPHNVPQPQMPLAGSGLPHGNGMDTSFYNHYGEYGYHPMNAKLAVPAPLPSIGSIGSIGSTSPAAQQHDMMYGSSPDLSLTTTLNNVLSSSTGNPQLIPVRLPNGMQMQVPSDELASMPNALPSLDLPSTPFLQAGGGGAGGAGADTTAASGEWRQKLAQVQNNIAAQQAQFTQQSTIASQTMLGKEQESQQLQQRLQLLQKSLLDAKNAAETQKEWLEQVARRNAALEVDKHKVQAEAQLAGITLEYQQVRAQDDKLRQDMLKVAASKEGLMKQAYAFRSVVRSDAKAIQKLMQGGKSTADKSATSTTTTDSLAKAMLDDDLADKKAEASELAAVNTARLAAKKVEEAGAEDSKASDVALQHMQSPPFEVPSKGGGSAGGRVGGASGPGSV